MTRCAAIIRSSCSTPQTSRPRVASGPECLRAPSMPRMTGTWCSSTVNHGSGCSWRPTTCHPIGRMGHRSSSCMWTCGSMTSRPRMRRSCRWALVPAQDQRFLMPCGPSADQDQAAKKLSAAHGLPSLGERSLRRLVAPRKGLDPETNRSGDAEDQQKRDDPAHRWLLPPTPCQLGAAGITTQGRARGGSGSTCCEGEAGSPVPVVWLPGRRTAGGRLQGRSLGCRESLPAPSPAGTRRSGTPACFAPYPRPAPSHGWSSRLLALAPRRPGRATRPR